MPADSKAIRPRKPMARSRVGNGKVLIEGVDGRGRVARRFHDIVADLSRDLGGLSEAERQQVRVAAGVLLASEQMTAAVIRGEAVDSEELTRTANVASRLLAQLKRGRQHKAAAPTLAEYLAAKRQAEAAPA